MYQPNNTLTPLGKLLLGGLAIYAICNELATDDTRSVVYMLYNRGKIVYVGITYADRIDQRIYEHECKLDWVFDEYDYGGSMSREKALARERKLIRVHAPKYNIHHNC